MEHLLKRILILALIAPTAAYAAAGDHQDDSSIINVHGLTKSQVEARFGTPEQRLGPVPQQGTDQNPPITTWVFDHFNIYFERDIALHRVEHHKIAQ
ncbi:MAG TPA: hypothetical protein ENM98_03460 [Halothiobacillaceae bacterium]|nr:hypothetical protein [Halothiobacillaceae bacterium]